MKERNESLDCLKGIAILLVMQNLLPWSGQRAIWVHGA